MKVLLALIISVFCFSLKTWATDDAILAVVNDELITLRDFKEYLTSIYMQQMAEGRSEEEIRQVMSDLEINGLSQLVDDKMLVAEANRQGLEIRPGMIDSQIASIKKRYKSEQEFLTALSIDGWTVSDLRNRITDQMKSRYVVEKEVRSKIYVNPSEVTEYYQKNLKQYQEPEKIDLDSIFIGFGEDKNRARDKIYEASSLLQLDKPFEEIAKNYSQAPSIGVIQRGQLLPSLEKSIFKLSEDETSSVIETDNGFYIFKLKKRIPSKVLSLNEVKKDIYNIIFQEKFKTRLKKWVDDLRQKAYIEIKS